MVAACMHPNWGSDRNLGMCPDWGSTHDILVTFQRPFQCMGWMLLSRHTGQGIILPSLQLRILPCFTLKLLFTCYKAASVTCQRGHPMGCFVIPSQTSFSVVVSPHHFQFLFHKKQVCCVVAFSANKKKNNNKKTHSGLGTSAKKMV